MKKIKLTQGKFALVDDEDFEWLNKRKWTYDKGGYAYRKIWIGGVGKKERKVYMHRLILEVPKGKVTDHKNGNKLDNRKFNLSVCTQFENMKNCKISKNNVCGYKGVSQNKKGGNWNAEIMSDGKRYRFFGFKTTIEAAKKYNELAIKYHGKYAKLNQI